jgi:DNA repair exonuclease SbcCD ATPase subunit
MQKQKSKKGGKKAAAEEPSKNEPTEKPSSTEPAAEMPETEAATDEQQAKGEEESPAEPMPDAPTSPGPEASPAEVKELPTREAHARQPSLSVQSKIRSSSFRNSISSTVSPGSAIKSPPLPPLAPDDEQIHEVFRKQAARLEDLEKENKRLEKEFNNANTRRQKAEDQLEELRESSVEVIELKDRLAKAEKQVAELETLVCFNFPGYALGAIC